MAIAISRAEYDALWRDSAPGTNLASDLESFEKIQWLSEAAGQGSLKWIELERMALCLHNYQLYEDLIVEEIPQSGFIGELGFNLSGNRSGKHSGENFLIWGTEEDGWRWKTEATDPIIKVDIHFEDFDPYHGLIGEVVAESPAINRNFCEKDGIIQINQINLITPAMRVTIEQILSCPFRGKTRQIYLESKCLELLALKLAQIAEGKPYPQPRSLKPDDIERIHLARSILLANFANPPSLLELARKVSLNDYKLKLGFRQVFGETVFGYLQRYRLEKAQQMLSEGRMNVKQVAQAVGYANQSRFASAFRKQYGVNPKSFL